MSLAGGDLTTLTTLKGYLTSAPGDAVLSGLISRLSRGILSQLNRPILVPKDYTQQFSGTGTRTLVLPNWPLLTLSTVYVSGASAKIIGSDNDAVYDYYGIKYQPWDGIPPGDPAILEYAGGYYVYGSQNIAIAYRAGYQVTDEAQTIPALSPFTIAPNAPYGIWATDEGVEYDNGVAMVATQSAPLVGQYQPPAPDASTPRTVYTFNSADAGRGIKISYGFVPYDVEQALLEFVMDRSAYRSRPGVKSQMLASQETITYDTRALSSFIEETLSQYKNILPPPIGVPV